MVGALKELRRNHGKLIPMNKNNKPSMYLYFQEFYPVNYMRNIALNNTLYDHVYLNDLDFMPRADIYPIIKKAILNRDMPLGSVSIRKTPSSFT